MTYCKEVSECLLMTAKFLGLHIDLKAPEKTLLEEGLQGEGEVSFVMRRTLSTQQTPNLIELNCHVSIVNTQQLLVVFAPLAHFLSHISSISLPGPAPCDSREKSGLVRRNRSRRGRN